MKQLQMLQAPGSKCVSDRAPGTLQSQWIQILLSNHEFPQTDNMSQVVDHLDKEFAFALLKREPRTMQCKERFLSSCDSENIITSPMYTTLDLHLDRDRKISTVRLNLAEAFINLRSMRAYLRWPDCEMNSVQCFSSHTIRLSISHHCSSVPRVLHMCQTVELIIYSRD